MLRALVVSTSGAAKRRHPCTAESPNLKTLRFFFFLSSHEHIFIIVTLLLIIGFPPAKRK